MSTSPKKSYVPGDIARGYRENAQVPPRSPSDTQYRPDIMPKTDDYNPGVPHKPQEAESVVAEDGSVVGSEDQVHVYDVYRPNNTVYKSVTDADDSGTLDKGKKPESVVAEHGSVAGSDDRKEEGKPSSAKTTMTARPRTTPKDSNKKYIKMVARPIKKNEGE
jgi:hypothetical protein